MNLLKTGAVALRFVRRNAPFLISAAAGIGLVALYVLTIKETEEAQEVIQESEEEEVHSFKMVKKIAKIYAPSFLCLMVTLLCIVSSAVISHHRIRDLTAYAAGITTAYAKYRQENIDQNGVDADHMIIPEVMKECVNEDPLDYLEDGDEGVLCMMNGYDGYFKVPNIVCVYSAILDLNKEMEKGPYEWVYLTEFWKKARVLTPMKQKYIGHGWAAYDLQCTDDYCASALYPNIYKETEESGLRWYMIDLPAPKPLDMII